MSRVAGAQPADDLLQFFRRDTARAFEAVRVDRPVLNAGLLASRVVVVVNRGAEDDGVLGRHLVDLTVSGRGRGATQVLDDEFRVMLLDVLAGLGAFVCLLRGYDLAALFVPGSSGS